MPNIVYIATSLDGYIADKDGKVDWLHAIPNPDNQDLGFAAFMDRIDALVMGRITFETVCGFDCQWPYNKPVFVLSNTLTSIPEDYQDKARLLCGPLPEILKTVHQQGYNNLYIDGGTTIQNFLKEDLIDEMIITIIPILLGGGVPLFGELAEQKTFEHINTDILLDSLVQTHYRRKC